MLNKMLSCLLLLWGIGGMAADLPPVEWKWGTYGLAPTGNPCAIPTPYPAKDWRNDQFAAWSKIDYSTWGKNVVFLGDSITQMWNPHPTYPNGAAVLQAYSQKYPRVQPHSLGMSSDEPQNTLWLITEGNLLRTFPAPRVIVLMVGINSLNRGHSPEQVAGGINNVSTVLRKIRPESKILLLGIWPCWDAKAPIRPKIRQTNQLIGAFADHRNVFFLDFGNRYVTAAGEPNPELLRDGIHPSEKGYALWAQVMFPYLDDLIQTGGEGEIWHRAPQEVSP